MREHLPDEVQLDAIRTKLISLEVDIHLLRLRLKAGFDPNQPRVPAGLPQGGRWTDESAGRSGGTSRNPRASGNARIESPARHRHVVTLPNGQKFTFETNGPVQTIYDGNGRPISRSRWTAAGAEAMPLVRPAATAPTQPRDALEAARYLYNWLSKTPTSGELVCLAFSAQQFKPNQSLTRVDFVGKLSRAETAAVCKRLDTVQTFIDEAMAEARAAGPYPSAAVFGTAVHMRLRDKVRSLHDPSLTAELSIWRQIIESPLDPTAIRYDVLEDTGDGPICVYDLKTGRRGLSTARISEFAKRLGAKGRPIVVIEMRPFE